jgi:hypothetical protein
VFKETAPPKKRCEREVIAERRSYLEDVSAGNMKRNIVHADSRRLTRNSNGPLCFELLNDETDGSS